MNCKYCGGVAEQVQYSDFILDYENENVAEYTDTFHRCLQCGLTYYTEEDCKLRNSSLLKAREELQNQLDV